MYPKYKRVDSAFAEDILLLVRINEEAKGFIYRTIYKIFRTISILNKKEVGMGL